MVSEVRLKFPNSLRAWQSHYVVINQIVNFETKLYIQAEFCWQVAKFVAGEVRVIRCSSFGNITTNDFKQSEKMLNQKRLIL